MAEKEMELPETFIVTLANGLGTFEMDLELPAQLPFGKMKDKLLDILKFLDAGKFGGWQGCHVQYGNRLLADGENLADVGAFDGSRLTVLKG